MQTEFSKTVFEAADLARFCEADVATIYTWVKKGEISHFKTPGGRFRFKREAVLDFLRRFRFPIPTEIAEHRGRVIAIDDDPEMLTIVRCALERALDVLTFGDPYEGLVAIGSEKPDAVVMDVKMPALDGMHCIRRIRARENLRHTRIVVFSVFEGEQQACLDAGASAVVSKPRIEELHRELRRALGQR